MIANFTSLNQHVMLDCFSYIPKFLILKLKFNVLCLYCYLLQKYFFTSLVISSLTLGHCKVCCSISRYLGAFKKMFCIF